MRGQLLDHFWRGGHDIGTDTRSVQHVVHGTDRRGEDFSLEPVVVIDRADVLDQVHTVKVDVIQTPDEWRDEGGTGLGGDQRLVRREAERDVDHLALVRQHFTGFQTVPCQGQLHGDVFRDLGQFAAFGDHVVRFGRDNFGRDGAVDQITDLFRDFQNVAAGFQDQRRVCCHPVYHAQIVQLGDGIDFGGIYEEFHVTSFRLE